MNYEIGNNLQVRQVKAKVNPALKIIVNPKSAARDIQ